MPWRHYVRDKFFSVEMCVSADLNRVGSVRAPLLALVVYVHSLGSAHRPTAFALSEKRDPNAYPSIRTIASHSSARRSTLLACSSLALSRSSLPLSLARASFLPIHFPFALLSHVRLSHSLSISLLISALRGSLHAPFGQSSLSGDVRKQTCAFPAAPFQDTHPPAVRKLRWVHSLALAAQRRGGPVPSRSIHGRRIHAQRPLLTAHSLH